MIIRRYTGSSMDKIRETITSEMGPEAVIIDTRSKRRKGALPGVGSVSYQVTAAVEDAHDADTSISAEENNSTAEIQEFFETQREQYRGLRRSIKMLDEKLAEVDERMTQFFEHEVADKAGGDADASGEDKSEGEQENLYPKTPQDLIKHLHPAWRDKVLESLEQEKPDENDWEAYTNSCIQSLRDIIPVESGFPYEKGNGNPSVFAFVGPTGVGKTTTLAKLASNLIMQKNVNVGLISLDTFRIGAVEQLREYAALLGAELKVAFSANEVKKQLEEFQDKDVVLMDTHGRSQFDSQGIREIQQMLVDTPNTAISLNVPAAVRPSDATAIYEHFAVMEPSSIIITKTDEASFCDGLSHLLHESGLPVAYLTDGQNVPQDIHEASTGVVASLILSNENLFQGA